MSVTNFNSNTENKDEWLTPPEIVQSLGVFDLDPCQPIRPPFTHARHGFNILDDGLSKDWSGYNRIWCNPPYGNSTFIWLEKLANHGNGIALIFARTETKGFHRQIWERATGVFFFEGRLRFYHVDGKQGGTANAPSCLVAYGNKNVEAIRQSELKGRLVIL